MAAWVVGWSLERGGSGFRPLFLSVCHRCIVDVDVGIVFHRQTECFDESYQEHHGVFKHGQLNCRKHHVRPSSEMPTPALGGPPSSGQNMNVKRHIEVISSSFSGEKCYGNSGITRCECATEYHCNTGMHPGLHRCIQSGVR